MAVSSTMLPLGTRAPSFLLPDPATGRMVSRDDFARAPALLVIFLCNHCPYVKHVRTEIARTVGDYQARGLAAVGISANDISGLPRGMHI